MKINPPIKLNFKVKPSNMNDIPKYIGFLEYLKIPVTTREEAFSIEIGLTVVSWFLNEIIAVTRTDIPTIKEIILNELSIEKLNSGKNDFEKYIQSPKNKVKIGGGILLFMLFLDTVNEILGYLLFYTR